MCCWSDGAEGLVAAGAGATVVSMVCQRVAGSGLSVMSTHSISSFPFPKSRSRIKMATCLDTLCKI